MGPNPPLEGSNRGLKQLGAPIPRGPHHFPNEIRDHQSIQGWTFSAGIDGSAMAGWRVMFFPLQKQELSARYWHRHTWKTQDLFFLIFSMGTMSKITQKNSVS